MNSDADAIEESVYIADKSVWCVPAQVHKMALPSKDQFITDIKKMTPESVCTIKKEDIFRWLGSENSRRGKLSAQLETKIQAGYQRVCLRHKLDGLGYHIGKSENGKELHTVVARIPKSSKIAPGKAKTNDEVVDSLVVLASCPVYIQLEVDSASKSLLRVHSSFCPCKRGYKCRHEVAMFCVIMSLCETCTSLRQSWHRNVYMPFTAEMEQSIAQICSTKQDITMIEFKNEELGKIKERNFLVRKACQGKHQYLHQHVRQHAHQHVH